MTTQASLQPSSASPSRAVVVALLVLLLPLVSSCQREALGPGEERASADEARITDKMIDAIKAVTDQRYPDGDRMRFNQVKSLGCLDATFAIDDGIPDAYRHGVFSRSGSAYQAQLRFANATKLDDTEKDFRGLSIKLHGVDGTVLWGESGQQDFLLNSYPALFAADPEDFLAFIEAQKAGGVFRYFINPRHFYSLLVVLKGREKISNPFAIRYWSTTPYRLGPDQTQAVKYSVKPCNEVRETPQLDAHANFLSEAMQQQLQQGPVCLAFMVQKQTDPDAMPIEDASVIWDESVSPYTQLATITIQNQQFQAPNRRSACEKMTFNPWQSLPEHRPLGGINRVRKPVYSEIARYRLDGQSQGQ